METTQILQINEIVSVEGSEFALVTLADGQTYRISLIHLLQGLSCAYARNLRSVDGQNETSALELRTHLDNEEIHGGGSAVPDYAHGLQTAPGVHESSALAVREGLNNLSSHLGNTGLHFPQGGITHYDLQDIGSNTHLAIDGFIADFVVHTQGALMPHSALESSVLYAMSLVDTVQSLQNSFNMHLSEGTPLVWSVAFLSNNWSGALRYSKDSSGVVRFYGTVGYGGISRIITELPVGYRPASPVQVPIVCSSSTFGTVTISSNGEITHTSGTLGSLNFAGISFVEGV